MSATRSSALALAFALAACQTREVEVRPFRIEVVNEAGASVSEGATTAARLQVLGTASPIDAASFAVAVEDPPGTGTLTVRFDPVEPVVLPDAITRGTVTLIVFYDPGARGPGGEPLPIRGLRVADARGRSRFYMGEGDLRDPAGIPAVPRPLNPETLEESGDLPILTTVPTGLAFEPSDCGDAYYDQLRVAGASTVELERGDRAVVEVQTRDLPPWTVLHVDSWHRTRDAGGGECDGRLDAWFQAAGWR